MAKASQEIQFTYHVTYIEYCFSGCAAQSAFRCSRRNLGEIRFGLDLQDQALARGHPGSRADPLGPESEGEKVPRVCGENSAT